MLHIHLLGQFRLVSGDTPLTGSFTPRLQALLAYLALRRGAPQPRQHLAFLLWPDSTEAQARTNLRKQVHQLRRNLPGIDALLADDGAALCWQLDAPSTLDVADFERGVTADSHDPAAARASLEHALSLYSGPLLPGCYDDWILPERERLHQMFLQAAERLIQILESDGDHRQAIGYAQGLLRHDPLHEVTYRHLMRLYALSGDRIGALRVYRTCETILQRELGVEPSAATREVYERMVKVEAPRRSSIISQASPAVEKKHNLPLQLTSFIGREREMAEIERLLAETRLLTLTGAGGSGKTRLALQVAGVMARENRFADGVWWVELAALSDPALVAQAVASTFRLHDRPGQTLTEALPDTLRARHVLLVLDNCEHLIDACAELSEGLLRTCPHLQILATSREGLGVAGERTWPAPGLSAPGLSAPGLSAPARDRVYRAEEVGQSESARLFVERAAAALPTFRLTERNAAAVAEVCRRLDGIPLAIELAATRVKLLGVEQLAVRLADSFQVLTAGSRTALPRHQTLQAAIDWSHDLLPAAEQELWRRLSVFAGGFTLAAVEAVCTGGGIDAGDILELLSHLIDKSVVLAAEQEEGGEVRYRLLETVRQYGWQKWREAGGRSETRPQREEETRPQREDLQRQHAHFFLALAEAAEQHLTSGEQALWLSRLEVEHDNLRAALGWWLGEGEAIEAGLRTGSALWRFWSARGYLSEGRQWLEQLLAAGHSAPAPARAKAMQAAATLARLQGDYAYARTIFEQVLALCREQEDRRGVATALHSLGIVSRYQGDLEQAMVFHEESLRLRRELGDKGEVAITLNNLGIVARRLGDYSRARTLLEESLTLCREYGDRQGMARAYHTLGNVVRGLGDYAQAKACLEESLALYRELGDKSSVAGVIESLGAMARNQHELDRAIALHEESLAFRREIGEMGGVAGSLNSLGWARLEQRDAERARACFEEGLALNREQGDKHGMVEHLHGLAAAAAVQRESIRAARLLGAVEALREAVGALLTPDDRVITDPYTLDARNQLDEATFASAWAAGRALGLEEAIAEALAGEGGAGAI